MEEVDAIKEFAAQPDAEQQIFARIAPQIFGSEDIKKAVACLLFGGTRKVSAPPAARLPIVPPSRPSCPSCAVRIVCCFAAGLRSGGAL
jgi:MCM P-loop domain